MAISLMILNILGHLAALRGEILAETKFGGFASFCP